MNRRCVSGRAYRAAMFVVAAFVAMPAGALANGLIICPVPPGPHPLPPEPFPRQPFPPYPRPPRPPRIGRPIVSWMPFRIRQQQVSVEINDALADTEIEQVFVNQSGGQAEGTYLFPIAENAGVHKFAMWMNGKEVSGELLDAEKARQIYESIVSKMRDPGLLQFAGRGLIQAKVFPVPAGGECRIRLRYSEPVRADNGLAGYRYPLGSSGWRFEPIERFSLSAVVRSARPLASVFSPTHECGIERRSEREIAVSLEKQRLSPEDDFQLYINQGGGPFGLALLTYRVPGEDGFFMARISPQMAEDEAALPKNICFVLDTSGSMAEADKIAQAKRALSFCITNLGREDRFNVLTFATEVKSFREGWSIADEASKSAAKAFISELGAVGGTDINDALLKALALNPAAGAGGTASADKWATAPFMVVFITDGEPTVGVTDPEAILKSVATANPAAIVSPERRIVTEADLSKRSRVFVLGVGHQVNTKLLDRLADDNGGARDYVTPTEDLELKISGFYTKLAHPVLANLRLAYVGVSVQDVYPRQLPDLFRGSELVVVGRYGGAPELKGQAGSGTAPIAGARSKSRIELTGYSRGASRGFSFDCSFPAEDRSADFLPRLWAMRKIGFLLDELRLHGENRELKDEVIRLAKKYGILTPYTSFLVQEDEQLAVREGRAPVGLRRLQALGYVADDMRADMDESAARQGAFRGGGAVEASQENLRLRVAAAQPASRRVLQDVQGFFRDRSGESVVNLVGSRTFYLEDGRWVDADYDGKAETIKLPLFSRAYYDFVASNRDAGPLLAQGERVVLAWRGQVYETVPEEAP